MYTGSLHANVCSMKARDTYTCTFVHVSSCMQGGPGASSTGFGNFEELGPLDVNLQPRNTTWVGSVGGIFLSINSHSLSPSSGPSS